jgi:hypothetical protein
MRSNEKIVYEYVGVFTFMFIIAALWNIYAGKDINWDQLNYHVYVAHRWMQATGGFQQDYFAASIQSWLNPISYVPFYWMLEADWNDFTIAMVLAAFHCLNAVLVYAIARKILVYDDDGIQKKIWTLIAFLLGLLSPIFWQEIGSSFNDISTSVLVLLGLFILIRQDKATRRHIFFAGMILGVATGLKLPNGIFAFAGTIFILSSPSIKSSLSNVGLYVLAGVIGFLLIHGYWSYLLWMEYQNPFFPFFNSVFQSEHFVKVSLSLTRFIPATPEAALALPFELARPLGWIYTETTAPDIRPLIVVILSIVLLAKKVGTGLLVKETVGEQKPLQLNTNALRFIIFFLTSILLWKITSANGRYSIPLFLLHGLVIVLLLNGLMRDVMVRYLIVGCLILFQMANLFTVTNERWSPHEWEGKWIDVDLPKELVETPKLFISLSEQSHAHLARLVHPNSSFVNLIGQYRLQTMGENFKKMNALLSKHYDNSYALLYMPTESVKFAKDTQIINDAIEIYGLSMRVTGCKVGDIKSKFRHESLSKNLKKYKPLLVFCPIHKIPTSAKPDTYAKAVSVIEKITAQCHKTFQPAGVQVLRYPESYHAYFVGTEFSLNVHDNGRVVASQVRNMHSVHMGHADQWLTNDPKSKISYCPKRQRVPAEFRNEWRDE